MEGWVVGDESGERVRRSGRFKKENTDGKRKPARDVPSDPALIVGLDGMGK